MSVAAAGTNIMNVFMVRLSVVVLYCNGVSDCEDAIVGERLTNVLDS